MLKPIQKPNERFTIQNPKGKTTQDYEEHNMIPYQPSHLNKRVVRKPYPLRHSTVLQHLKVLNMQTALDLNLMIRSENI
jgi:hypothetical protein